MSYTDGEFKNQDVGFLFLSILYFGGAESGIMTSPWGGGKPTEPQSSTTNTGGINGKQASRNTCFSRFLPGGTESWSVHLYKVHLHLGTFQAHPAR